jgi:adenylate cyclase
MGVDDVRTLYALSGHRRDLIDPTIAGHRGRIIKTTSDGALVESGSAVDAVRCAVVFYSIGLHYILRGKDRRGYG